MSQSKITTEGKRPAWLGEWSDYPHASLSLQHSREIVWYAIELEDQVSVALKTLKAVLNVFGNHNRPETLARVREAIVKMEGR